MPGPRPLSGNLVADLIVRSHSIFIAGLAPFGSGVINSRSLVFSGRRRVGRWPVHRGAPSSQRRRPMLALGTSGSHWGSAWPLPRTRQAALRKIDVVDVQSGYHRNLFGAPSIGRRLIGPSSTRNWRVDNLSARRARQLQSGTGVSAPNPNGRCKSSNGWMGRKPRSDRGFRCAGRFEAIGGR